VVSFKGKIEVIHLETFLPSSIKEDNLIFSGSFCGGGDTLKLEMEETHHRLNRQSSHIPLLYSICINSVVGKVTVIKLLSYVTSYFLK
jgi:hypothetical protein